MIKIAETRDLLLKFVTKLKISLHFQSQTTSIRILQVIKMKNGINFLKA